ncbi:DNA replication/repair protein RecF [Anaeroselena agilis]|uniref:DNA replication and repair protein RecF n=1 Tax=Anaeroselena agilis TaxID=3063788 RepID=A0ABU3P2U7_9FIRM|nr:DNA replication/repair protein RecF [Selenomonadales bacterium 4137-cl]
MRVDRLSLRNYRNYKTLDVNFTNNINIFVGENAQGKTNILEAVYLGAVGRSHRTAEDDDLVKWDQDSASVDLFFTRHNVENKLGFRLIKGRNKEILFNDFIIKPREVIGSLNVVLFSPEDLWLIKGAPSLRRRFLDIEISQASPLYYRNLLQYNRAVTQRNHLLKKVLNRNKLPELLPSWDEQLAKLAAFIVDKRLEAVKKLGMLANLMHRRLTGSRESLSFVYQMAGGEDDIPGDLYQWYRDKLAEQREVDIARGSTSVGPHRDDIILRVNARELRSFGSQGQQRTGILALKLAELEFLKSETGEYPVLLLDDVMSELDSLRREQLLSFIRDRVQTFITATDATLFPAMRAGRYFRVQDGKITE